jgi:hypothetical protein
LFGYSRGTIKNLGLINSVINAEESNVGQIYVGGNLHTNKDFNVADYNGLDVFMGVNFTLGKSKYWDQHKWTETAKKQQPILEKPIETPQTPQQTEQPAETIQQPTPQTQPSNPQEVR